jgi:hypothetical protein
MTGYHHFRLVFASKEPPPTPRSLTPAPNSHPLYASLIWCTEKHMDLALVLQRLYDSEISLTITMLPDGGFDFALISYMEWQELGRPIDYMTMIASVEPRERPPGPDPWHNVSSADQLAAAIHDAAVEKYPNSGYAKLYARPN